MWQLALPVRTGFPEGYVGQGEVGEHEFTGAATLFGPEPAFNCDYVLRIEPAQPGPAGDSVPFASVGLWFDVLESRAHSVSFPPAVGDCFVRLETMDLPRPDGNRGAITNLQLFGRLDFREVSDTVIHLVLDAQVEVESWNPVRFEARVRR